MTEKRYFINPAARSDSSCRGLFGDEVYSSVRTFLQRLPQPHFTPLHHLPALASEMGVGDIRVKDESARYGLNSFKILGVTYAVGSLLGEGRLTEGSVLACATEGNHGRAVARVAAANHLEAKVYVAANTNRSRREAIEAEGAKVVAVDGSYDDAVRQAARDADRFGWLLVSDTSWPGYEEIPRRIMAGYTHLMTEAEEQWTSDPPPDVVLVQAGVGGLAGAVMSWLCRRYGEDRPFVIVCEPASAACFLESSRAGKPVALPGPFDTVMTGLRCGVVSSLAWPLISTTADAFLSIYDEECASAMRTFAHPQNGDPIVTAGASGACGLAALLATQRDGDLRPLREASNLDEQSRILVFNTEGVTNPETYARITGSGICSGPR